MANTVRVATQVTGARQGASELDQLRDKFDRLQKQGAKGFAIGAGAAITAGAIGLVSNAVAGLGDVVGDSIQAFREDQASQAKLAASLKANIPAWDGNTKAIEGVLAARMKLGFSDDEQRDSLSILVAKTHDVTKALEIQRAAMDLARLKGIDLAGATKAVSLGMSGQGRALKELGINVKDLSSQEEVLAAITKAAGGQAEKFATTDLGKAQAAAVKTGEAMERLGSILSGPTADGATIAADALTALFDLMDAHTGQTEAIADSIKDQITNGTLDGLKQSRAALQKGIGDIGFWQMLFGHGQGDAEVAALKKQLADVDAAIADYARGTDVAAKRAAESMRDSARSMGGSWDSTAADMEKKRGTMIRAIDSVGDHAKDAARDYEGAAGRIRTASAKTAKQLVGDASDAIDRAFDPMIDAYDLVAQNSEVSAARRKVAAKDATDADKQALLEAEKAQAGFLLKLAEAGNTNSKVFRDGMESLRKTISETSGPAKVALQGVYDKIVAIDKLNPKVNIVIDATLTKNAKAFGVRGGVIQDFSTSLRRRAGGGRVERNEPVIVGENGPEVFAPDTAGNVIPNGRAGGGSMTFYLNVHPAPGMTPAQGRDWANQFGPQLASWMQRNGILPRGASPMFG